MDLPLVSIIMPVYNSEKHIAQSISSALNQTWANKELIIVDDGSTDSSLSVAKGFESENVRVFNQKNSGASAARNKGLKEAKGSFIQFLDADDLLSQDKIMVQMELLQQNPGKIAACGTIHFDDGLPLGDGVRTPNEDDFLFSDNDPAHFLIHFLGGFKKVNPIISVHAWLTPKSIIDKAGPWNEELTADDDGEFFSRVILNSSGIVKTNGFSYYRKYTTDYKSLSSGRSKKALESIFKSISLKKKHLFGYDNSDAAQRAIQKQLVILAVSSYSAHTELYKLINEELKNYQDYSYTPILGGVFINYLAKLLGWRVALKIKLLIRK